MHADSGAVVAIPSSGPPNTVVGLQNQFTSSTGERIIQFFTAVIMPSGFTYACTNLAGCPVIAAFIVPGGTAFCTVPFGGPGFFDPTGTTGGASVTGCGPLLPNSAAWFPVAPNLLPVLQSMCLGGSPLTPLGAPSTGSTSELGVYQVITCWMNAGGGPGFPVNTTFLISPSQSVPEFPLGMVAVVGVTMALVVFLRAGTKKGDALSVSP